MKTPRGLGIISVGKRGIQESNNNINQTKVYNILSDLTAAILIRIDSSTGYVTKGMLKSNWTKSWNLVFQWA